MQGAASGWRAEQKSEHQQSIIQISFFFLIYKDSKNTSLKKKEKGGWVSKVQFKRRGGGWGKGHMATPVGTATGPHTSQFSGGPWSSHTQDGDPDIHMTCNSHNGRGHLREKKLAPGALGGAQPGEHVFKRETSLRYLRDLWLKITRAAPAWVWFSSSSKRTFQNVPRKPDCTRYPVWALKSSLKTTLRSRKTKTRGTKQKLPSKHSKGN